MRGVERNLVENALVHTFPDTAAPIATNDADATLIRALSTFVRAARHLQLQYTFTLPWRQSIGLFWEIYNAANWINYGNPTGNRNSRNFMIPVQAGPMRSMQLGARYSC